MKRRLAIIPARAGSKRVPKKNIRDFCGKPMISYILSAAHSSGLFSKIHVSTESEEVNKVVSFLGFHPDFYRPSDLADDHTPIMPVLRYVVNEYIKQGIIFDEVWLLMACAPFIEPHILIDASRKFHSNGCLKPLMAVAEFPVPIEWAYSKDLYDNLSPLNPGMFARRSQDFEKRFFDAGSFVVFPTSNIITAEDSGTDHGFVGYVIPKKIAIDIDDEEDWALAEAIFRRIESKSIS